MLSIEDFSLSFRRYRGFYGQHEIPCLRDVSFTLKRGEVVAVIGASGSGKSMLAQAILGLLPDNVMTEGTIRIDGKITNAAERFALCGNRIVLVPQSISHLDPLVRSGKQIAWAAQRSGRSTQTIPGLVINEMERFQLDEEVARAFPHQLSGGMARRVMLAIASVGNAELVLADEPTNGLDPDNARVVFEHLRQLALEQNKAVMLITHDLAAALPYADRVAILREGQFTDILSAETFTHSGTEQCSPYARALWQALPQNGFNLAQSEYA